MEKDKLILKLHQEGKSDGEIAKILKYKSGETIRQYRIKHGLKSNGRKSLEKFDRNEAEKLFQKGKSYKEIAEIFGCSKITINIYFLKKYGKVPSFKRQGKNIELTQEQKEIIFGALLGDMSMQLVNKAINPRGKIEHGIKQLSYIEYKHKLLENLSSNISIKDRFDNRFKNPNYKICYFSLNANPSLLEFYKKFYYNNRKIVPEDLSLLTPLAIAIWFMDDGCKNGIIATNSFSKNDVERIKNYLMLNYLIETTINSRNELRIRKNSFNKFKNLILPYICESMKYKVT